VELLVESKGNEEDGALDGEGNWKITLGSIGIDEGMGC
jgi:hypothetical protein